MISGLLKENILNDKYANIFADLYGESSVENQKKRYIQTIYMVIQKKQMNSSLNCE